MTMRTYTLTVTCDPDGEPSANDEIFKAFESAARQRLWAKTLHELEVIPQPELHIIAWSYDWEDNITSVRGFDRMVAWLIANFELKLDLKDIPQSYRDDRWRNFASYLADVYNDGAWKSLNLAKIDHDTGNLFPMPL
jgi:predicted alpha-1,6-mannanase (GH76 family)